MHRQTGAIQFPMLVLTLCLMSFVLAFQNKARDRIIEMQKISNHYLCLKEGMRAHAQFSHQVAKTNRMIQVFHYSQSLSLIGAPQAGKAARMAKRALIKYQNYLYVSFMKKLWTLPHCRPDQSFQFSLIIPYQNSFGLIAPHNRYYDGTLKTRKSKKWSFYYTNLLWRNSWGMPTITPLKLSIKDRFSSLSYHAYHDLNLKDLSKLGR